MKNIEYLSGIADVYSDSELKDLGIVEGLGKASVNKKSVYEVVNDYFINELNKGIIPWRKTWTENVTAGASSQLMNFRSKRAYTGVNPWLIASLLEPHHCNYFLTKSQIEGRGGKIKKGATRFMVVYFGTAIKTIQEPPTKENPKGSTLSRIIRFLKSYEVFNLADTDIDWKANLPEPPTKEERLDNCEQVYKQMPKAPPLYHKEQSAFYSPAGDYVNMPKYQSFKKPQEYYCTLFHELIHSTGHAKRLKREFGLKFGNQKYAFEELIAEIGASYLCAYTGILFFTRKNSVAYLQSWMKSLVNEAKSNKTFFFEAASKSQKAANFILSKQIKQTKKSKKKAPKKNLSGLNKETKIVEMKRGVIKPAKSNKNTPVQTIVTKSPELTDIEKYFDLHNKEVSSTTLFILAKTVAKRLREKTYTAHLDLLNEINNRLQKAVEQTTKAKLTKVKATIDLAMIDRCKKAIDSAKVVLRTDYLAGNDLAIANEIYRQIGKKAFFMLGAKNFVGDKDSLSFKISGSKAYSHIKVRLNSLDLYDMTFYKIVGNEIKNEKTVEGLYFDMLHSTIEQETGLYTSLGASKNISKAKPQNKVSKKKVLSPKLSGIELMQELPKPTITEAISEAFGWEKTHPANTNPKPSNSVATKSDSLFKPITHIETRETFNLKGDLGKFLGNLERYELSMTIEGDQGAGKTQFAFQLADAFAQAGYEVGFFSLEIGAGSDIIKRNRDKYLSPQGLKRVLIAGDAPKGIDTIREYARKFGVIIIDSFTKLNADSREFDKLRKDFPETIWIVLFQRTSGGTIRGGTAPLFDAGINIEVVKEDETFLNNYAVATKNRYGMTGLKFNISQQKIV